MKKALDEPDQASMESSGIVVVRGVSHTMRCSVWPPVRTIRVALLVRKYCDLIFRGVKSAVERLAFTSYFVASGSDEAQRVSKRTIACQYTTWNDNIVHTGQKCLIDVDHPS